MAEGLPFGTVSVPGTLPLPKTLRGLPNMSRSWVAIVCEMSKMLGAVIGGMPVVGSGSL